MWPAVQFYFSNMSSPVRFQLESGYQVLPPHPAGGIYVYANFQHSGGKIAVSNSSAAWYGGAVLRSSSGVFGTFLR